MSESTIYSPSVVRSLLQQYGMHPQKRWGQNFLIDRNNACKIVDALPAGATVWEIGPGFGALTLLLFRRYARVVLFEIDYGMVAYLTQRWDALHRVSYSHGTSGVLPDNDACLVVGNALTTLPRALANNRPPDVLMGNLPYRTAAQILACCVQSSAAPNIIAVTVQREVAERMATEVGTRSSSFSVLMRLIYTVRICWTIPRTAFYPAPHVDSVFVWLTKRNDAAAVDVAAVQPLIRCAFQSRRATLHKNLMHAPQYRDAYQRLRSSAPSSSLIHRIHRQRAEQILPEEFTELARLLHAALPRSDTG